MAVNRQLFASVHFSNTDHVTILIARTAFGEHHKVLNLEFGYMICIGKQNVQAINNNFVRQRRRHMIFVVFRDLSSYFWMTSSTSSMPVDFQVFEELADWLTFRLDFMR